MPRLGPICNEPLRGPDLRFDLGKPFLAVALFLQLYLHCMTSYLFSSLAPRNTSVPAPTDSLTPLGTRSAMFSLRLEIQYAITNIL